MSVSADARQLIFGGFGIGFVTVLFRWWPQVSNAATIALSLLVVVLFVAASARLWVAVTTSLAAMLAFNFFFLPPVGNLTIADPQNWVALFAFLAVSLVATNLSAVARARMIAALALMDEWSADRIAGSFDGGQYRPPLLTPVERALAQALQAENLRTVDGMLFDLGAHLVDQAVQLFGPVVSVYAEIDFRRPGTKVDDAGGTGTAGTVGAAGPANEEAGDCVTASEPGQVRRHLQFGVLAQ
jgi:signal transduction histidine kinase